MLLIRLIGAVIAGAFATVVGVLVCGIIGTVLYEVLFAHGTSLSSIDPSDLSTVLQTPGLASAGTLIGVGCGILIGLIVFIQSVSYAFKRDRLSKGGMRISALVSAIKHRYVNNASSPGNSYTVYTVHAEWLDPRTGSRYRFKQDKNSRPVVREGEYVTVQVNPRNYNDYHLEL
ncbi:hypothetical protein KSC_040640 [Ktedonobacter sp. SOSP1-52]|uniref:hypothetical protein n=1 Tax=Ktedonobacter sp. SOSP1-52 TaxID=2778366 RepID=UPI001916383A|nr:hypothetical protein [Ktedonobacter sp. SOSP1-52]GHO65172.1 hypothetical protein KSC_040640 [Ktedonobacter sp. SOSP1-52]